MGEYFSLQLYLLYFQSAVFLFYLAHGNWSLWGAWSDCSVTCAIGNKTRNRTCTSGGNNCTGNSTDTGTCDLGTCDSMIFILVLFYSCSEKAIDQNRWLVAIMSHSHDIMVTIQAMSYTGRWASLLSLVYVPRLNYILSQKSYFIKILINCGTLSGHHHMSTS